MPQFLANEGFGDGSLGPLTLSGTPTLIESSCSGTAGLKALAATGAFVAGQMVRIKQMRGTGVGAWELNVVDSYVLGTITLKYAMDNTYTDSGASQATVLVVGPYGKLTHTLALTCPAWDGNVGGELFYISNQPYTPTGSIVLAGKGYRNPGVAGNGFQGEGTAGQGNTSETANGNGGGATADRGGAGGGGNATIGQTGATGGPDGGSPGGDAAGTADLTNIVMGGAGATGKNTGPGGDGAAMCTIMAPSIDISAATITGNGGNATNSGGSDGAAAGGAAASVLLAGRDSVALGTNRVNLAAGNGASSSGGGGQGGNGSEGRLAVWGPVSSIVTGSNSPNFTFLANNNIAANIQGAVI